MKLITRTTLLYLLVSIPLLALACWYTIDTVGEEVKDGTDEALYRERQNMENLIRSMESTKNLYLRSDSLTSIVIIPKAQKTNSFSDTVIYDKLEEGKLAYRVHRSYFFHNGAHYLITVCKPGLEEEELKEGLMYSFTIVFGLLLLSFFVLNIIVSRVLWKPFYSTLKKLETYDIHTQNEIRFDASSVKEFRQLNSALDKMTQKILSDYRQQKEFTENASHELQTPLAVIKTKLELLIQSKKLGAEELELLQGIESSVQKIAALNKALLLLTKIENKQFKEEKENDLKELMEKALETYGDIYQEKKIKSETKFTGNTTVKMNPVLADLLVNNLIQNAYRHNKAGGTVLVELDEGQLTVSNSGAALTISPEDLFVRFKKNDASKESLGLGLSIVKSIADICGFKISYEYKHNLHVFNIMLKP